MYGFESHRQHQFMKFNLETFVVGAKLVCVFAGTSLLTLQTGLGQWVHTENDPTIVQWVMVIGGSLGTGLTATGAFLSSAFGNYMNNAKANEPRPLQEVPKVLLTEAKKDDTVKPVL